MRALDVSGIRDKERPRPLWMDGDADGLNASAKYSVIHLSQLHGPRRIH